MKPEKTGTKVQIVQVDKRSEGQRLDNFLLRTMKGVPRSRVYRLVRRGEVRLNKKRAKPEQKLSLGDKVRIPPYLGLETRAQLPISEGLRRILEEAVIHEDEQLLVINKPAGVAVHKGTGVGIGVVEAMRQIHQRWAGLELAHRLDRDTSGCLVLAKNVAALRHLQDQFKQKSVDKTYLALVHGQWPAGLTRVDAPLRRDVPTSGERIVVPSQSGKTALTRFQIEKSLPHATLLKCSPVSGRTHQIRVHCQVSGHSIVGDPKYGQKSGVRLLDAHKKLCLHSQAIAFSHPQTGDSLRFTAALDPELDSLLEALEKSQ